MNATNRGKVDLTAVEDLEAAFARIGPVTKARMQASATAIHPDLRPAGWTVLRTVLFHEHEHPGEPLAVSDIIAATQMDKSVVSRQLRDLKEWELVTLTRSSDDARVFLVAPTELAKQRHRAIHERARAEYRRVLGTWDPADVRKLAELMTRLVDDTTPQH